MWELPPKKAKYWRKKAKKPNNFFWRQRPLKKAKFVKFGVKKVNLAILSLFAFSSQEGLWRTAGSCSGVSSVFLSRFWVSQWHPKILQWHPKFWKPKYGYALKWNDLRKACFPARGYCNGRMQCYRPTQFSGTEFGNENCKYGICALSSAPPRFGLSLTCRRFVQYGVRNCESNILQLWKCFTVSPLRSACLAMIATTMKTKGRQLQRACKTRWLSREATVRVRRAILAIWAALKQLSEIKNNAFCVVFLRLMKTKHFNMVLSFVNIGTWPDRTEQSFSVGMFCRCTGESFRRTVHQ